MRAGKKRFTLALHTRHVVFRNLCRYFREWYATRSALLRNALFTMLNSLSLQLCSSLRTSVRSARPLRHSPAFAQWRALSSATAAPSLLRHTTHYRAPCIFNGSQISRHLSLGSIFSRPATPSPSPTVVAHITRLEAEANVSPHDVSKQLALFEALRDTDMKSSYEVIVSRWERMCEFVRSARV